MYGHLRIICNIQVTHTHTKKIKLHRKQHHLPRTFCERRQTQEQKQKQQWQTMARCSVLVCAFYQSKMGDRGTQYKSVRLRLAGMCWGMKGENLDYVRFDHLKLFTCGTMCLKYLLMGSGVGRLPIIQAEQHLDAIHCLISHIWGSVCIHMHALLCVCAHAHARTHAFIRTHKYTLLHNPRD